MTDLVTDEMVEAAARELFEWDVEEHSDPRPAWEGLTEGQRDVWRSGARATLTAAALLIAAAAWEEGYTEGSRGRMWDSINPYQTRAHVDHIERGSAIGYATEHAATHACPSARASGEPCSSYCTDCGGRGWVA